MADEQWESGPYCRHWEDPADCDDPCACGHKCCKHQSGWCDIDDCDCDEWREPP